MQTKVSASEATASFRANLEHMKTLDVPHPKEPKAMKAIRRACLDCCGGQPGEVRLCPAIACGLWPFRLGIGPAGY